MEQFDARQELSFIKKVMADSRRVTVENGLDYIVWGLIVALGMFGTFALDRLHAAEWAAGGWIVLALWIAVMGGGWVFSLVRYLRHRRHARVHTLAGKMLGSIWLACGIAIMLLVFVLGPLGKADPSPAIATVLGIGFLLSGILMDFAPLRWASLCWWAGAVALALIRPVAVEMLVFGAMMVAFQVVPGIILHQAWREGAAGPQAERP
ncbi:MAG TPA: hypothetical protein VMF29_07855 [Candidatus Edwardsbacteria bacterium]|nr:hypothetical protein [Candidatus Edwardsbacteria bacterium]